MEPVCAESARRTHECECGRNGRRSSIISEGGGGQSEIHYSPQARAHTRTRTQSVLQSAENSSEPFPYPIILPELLSPKPPPLPPPSISILIRS